MSQKKEKEKVKNAAYGYIVAHSGAIDIAKCAEELGLSEAEVGEAIEVLQREGKIEGEKVSPPAKAAPLEEKPAPATPLKPEGRGRGKLVAIAVVVVAAVIAAVIGIYFLISAGGLRGVPIYSGFVENQVASAEITQLLENAGYTGVEVRAYTSTDNEYTIASWYETQMVGQGWTKENSWPYYGDYYLLFRKGNDGAMIVVSDGYVEGSQIFIVVGDWTKVSGVWQYSQAGYVSEPSPALIVCSADGAVYDYDSSAAVENYKNGKVSITVTILSGKLRSIGDPAYGGTIISVTNPTTGFSASISIPDNTNLWGSQITAVNTVPILAWGSEATDVVKMTATMTPNTSGELSAGSLISITLAPYGVDDAHDQTVASDRMADASMWDEVQTFNVTIAGRDSVSLSGYDGAYLMGMSWTV